MENCQNVYLQIPELTLEILSVGAGMQTEENARKSQPKDTQNTQLLIPGACHSHKKRSAFHVIDEEKAEGSILSRLIKVFV